MSSAEKAWSSNAELQQEIGQLTIQAGTPHTRHVADRIIYGAVTLKHLGAERVLLSVDSSQLQEALGLSERATVHGSTTIEKAPQ